MKLKKPKKPTKKFKPVSPKTAERARQSVEETLEALGDPEEIRGILKGRADIAEGRVEDLEEVIKRLL